MSPPQTMPLPAAVRQFRGQCTHPGLMLDKYAITWPAPAKLSEEVQRPTVESVVGLSKSLPGELDFAGLTARHQAALGGAVCFTARTTGPLTMHLSRAGALENAGLCLHPIYGFAYLPGTGLKGLARAYAETVAAADPADIDKVFGSSAQHGSAGSVAFHDAWPTAWPKLIADIVNNHHPKYYQGRDDRDPPGDWESPIPVYFLAIAPGTTWAFAVKGRRDDTDARLVELAKTWLIGGLVHLGAGAKTAAGYGRFEEVNNGQPAERPKLPATTDRHDFECLLELASPAYLAGASQAAEDCDLRCATLRGQLRWWWRTLHAGHLDVGQLRRLEAIVWGHTKASGAVASHVERVGQVGAIPSPFKDDTDRPQFSDRFFKDHRLEPSPKGQTQGLAYAAYGMDEKSHGQRRRRHCIEPGARWKLRLTARPVTIPAGSFEAQEPSTDVVVASVVLAQQARAALWLLCTFGGVGSKSRKGFGSFADPKELAGWSLEKCQQAAQEFRRLVGLREHQGVAETASHANRLGPIEVRVPWRDAWFAMDQIGASMIAFCQAPPSTGHGKHCEEKAALGLPRQIHGPRREPGPHQRDHQPPQTLKSPHRTDRYAAPVHLHLGKTGDGHGVIRAVAFPTRDLPDPQTSRWLLGEYLEHLQTDLAERVEQFPTRGPLTPPTVLPRAAAPTKRDQGTAVEVTYLGTDEKGKHLAQEPGREPGKISLGTPPQPLPEKDRAITVYIKDDAKPPQYQWQPPPPAKPVSRSAGPKRGGLR